MFLQVTRLYAPIRAETTSKWFFTAVYHIVSFEMPLIRELSVTNRTGVVWAGGNVELVVRYICGHHRMFPGGRFMGRDLKLQVAESIVLGRKCNRLSYASSTPPNKPTLKIQTN